MVVASCVGRRLVAVCADREDRESWDDRVVRERVAASADVAVTVEVLDRNRRLEPVACPDRVLDAASASEVRTVDLSTGHRGHGVAILQMVHTECRLSRRSRALSLVDLRCLHDG